MVQEICGMNGMREQAVARVDKEDKEQSGKQQGPELADGANLCGTSVSLGLHGFAGAGHGHDLQCDGSWLGTFRHCDSTSGTVPAQSDLSKQKKQLGL
jgi:hypothetical protein